MKVLSALFILVLFAVGCGEKTQNELETDKPVIKGGKARLVGDRDD